MDRFDRHEPPPGTDAFRRLAAGQSPDRTGGGGLGGAGQAESRSAGFPDGVGGAASAAFARERYLLVAFVTAAWRYRGVSREAIEDLVQETFTIAWARRSEFDPARPLGPWLRGIATNLMIAGLRREARRRRIMDDAKHEIDRVQALSARFDEVDARTASREVSAAVRDCIGRLAAPYREVIEKHYIGGRAFRAIGEDLGISEELAMKRASRARAMLAACLGRKGVISASDEGTPTAERVKRQGETR
jgi:RNA polymerase sigma-70 factor (ECF subfamily)